MSKYNIELDFNVDSLVWLTEKNSAGGLRLKKATIEEIRITADEIQYKYNYNGEQGTFRASDVGVFAFTSAEDANEHYSKEFNETLQNYGEFVAIFFMVRKKISTMKNCKHLNAGAKHCIATNLTYDICDALDKTQPLSRDATIKYLVDGLTKERVNVVIESEALDDDKDNIIAEKTVYKNVFAYLETTEDVFVISSSVEEIETESTKPLAKIYKNGVIMYMDNSQNDPIVNELIEELIVRHL